WTVGDNAGEQNDSDADRSESEQQESPEFLSMAGDLGAQPAYVVLNLKLSGLDILQSLVVGHTSDFQEVGVYISTVNGKLHQALQKEMNQLRLDLGRYGLIVRDLRVIEKWDAQSDDVGQLDIRV
ncbi:MAG: hypothetical protein KDK30_18255, partial [Leptospiraceae bacterium]|nr:hypothetical protein [Leptospiraceae bacterium]